MLKLAQFVLRKHTTARHKAQQENGPSNPELADHGHTTGCIPTGQKDEAVETQTRKN